jgi:mycoredoxin-dependent peroxiredoxin
LIGIGDTAPEFSLRDQNNEQVALSSFRGSKAALLIFYPFAFTGICTGELNRVRDELATFQNDDVQVLTISCDSPYAHKIFSERESFEFPLLSDFWPHGAVAQAYGVFNDKVGVAERGTFLVDRDGVVRFAEHNAIGEGRDPAAWQAAIKDL